MLHLLEKVLYWLFVLFLSSVGLGIIALPFWVFYAVIGAGKKWLKYKKWYARERTDVELIGRNEWIGNRDEEREVDNGWGNPRGKVVVPMPVGKVRKNYRYNYCCRKCRLTWSTWNSKVETYRL